MGQSIHAEITIGGEIRKDKIDKLFECIHEDGILWEYNRPFDPAADFEVGKTLTLGDYEAYYGEFTQTEQWCRDNGVPYSRWTDVCEEDTGPFLYVFRGSGDVEIFDAGTACGGVTICRGEAKSLGSYEAIMAYFEHADFTPPPIALIP